MIVDHRGLDMTTVEKKPAGRPRKYAGKRPTWTIRLEEKYGDQIKALAEQSGRSISEVCEQQIVNAFRMEIMCDLLEQKIEQLTQDLADCRNTGDRPRSRFDRRKGRAFRRQPTVRAKQ
jgi:hypothetical protein